ncbi:hypothetical protein BHE74_00002839 [Ensete ventricosum]|nr:hypothetical protein BHE74_00002839 [Ensete ventricosum]
MRGRGGMPVAFADFTVFSSDKEKASLQDTESSTVAMNGLQGILLESSDRGGVHVEYPLFLIITSICEVENEKKLVLPLKSRRLPSPQ